MVQIQQCAPVYLALHGIEVLSVTTKSVTLDLEMRQDILCHLLAVWLCLKMGSENRVLVRLLQIGANDLTVPHRYFCIQFTLLSVQCV